MKKKDPALWAAVRLHRILAKAHRRAQVDLVPSLHTLLQEQKAVERGWRMYHKAQSRGWTHTAGILAHRLMSDVALVNTASKVSRPPRMADVPRVPDIVAEITHLNDEFDDVEILPKKGRIDVTTDEITLEDVCLGTFCIQLHFDRLARHQNASAFVIVAQEANAASSKASCTHPHVSEQSLCAGDATAPISHALADGRIGDAFQLINRVLHTYNPSSAYVSLDDWDGRECSDCGRVEARDSVYSCENCDHDCCDDCIRTCVGCDSSICLDCSTENDDGNRLCPKCKERADQEAEDADDEQEDEEDEDEIEEDEDDEIDESDDPVHEPTEHEQPQPQTEITHAQSHSPERTTPQGAELPGGTPDGQVGDVTNDVAESQAA